MLTDKITCAECGACLDVCPQACISIECDPEGVWHPKVDEAACSHCGKCEQICPLFGRELMDVTRSESPQTLAGYDASPVLPSESTSEEAFDPQPASARAEAASSPGKIGRILRMADGVRRHMGFSPTTWAQFIHINLLRRNTQADVRHYKMLIPRRHCRIMLHSSAQLIFNGTLALGWKNFPKSSVETRLFVGRDAKLVINGYRVAYKGSDIRVLDNAVLTMDEGCLNYGAQIICAKSVTIGKSSGMGPDSIIRDHDGHHILRDDHQVAKSVHIGEHVWIGTRSMILKGVTIGDYAVIAAGAVVTKDVPAHTMVVGVPARVIRESVTWKY